MTEEDGSSTRDQLEDDFYLEDGFFPGRFKFGLATCLAHAIGRAKSACGGKYRLLGSRILHLSRCAGECGLTPLLDGEYRGSWHAQHRSLRTAFFGHIGL